MNNSANKHDILHVCEYILYRIVMIFLEQTKYLGKKYMFIYEKEMF